MAGARSGLSRGWAATRRGTASAVHFTRTHWGRAAYIYLGIVGIALLGVVTAAVATWFVKHSAEQAVGGTQPGQEHAEQTVTTLALIAERIERIEQAQVAQQPGAPCQHCAGRPAADRS